MKHFILFIAVIASVSLYGQKSAYELYWADEFNYKGLPDSTKWSYDVGGHGWGNNELQFYTKDRLENARVDNGLLTITAVKEKYKGCDYTSTRLVTAGKGDFLYGRIEIRAKLPKGRGTWPAIWMLSSDWAYGAWPESGEIDIMEHVGYNPNQIHFSIHCQDYFFKINTQKSSIMKVKSADSVFYTYAVEWTPDRITGFIDDSLYYSFDNERLGWTKWPFDKPFHLILNIAVGGGWGGAMGIDTTIWPQKLEIDYVRAYKLKDSKDETAPSTPVNLSGVANANNMVLVWDPAYDNYSVKEYQILTNGKISGTTRKHGYYLKGLQAETNYNIDIVALDWQGNKSAVLASGLKTAANSTFNIPGKIEAENLTEEKGTEIEKTRDTLGGYNICWIEPGDWMSYSINNTSNQNLKFTVRAATERIDAIVDLYNDKHELITSCPIGNTMSWQKWHSFTSPAFNLKTGSQKIYLKIRGDRVNINWFEIK